METATAYIPARVATARKVAWTLTGGDRSHYLDYHFYGPANAERRAAVLSALTGSRVPKSRAGWGVFRSALIAAAGIVQTCIADGDRQLGVWIAGGGPPAHCTPTMAGIIDYDGTLRAAGLLIADLTEPASGRR